MLTYRRNVPKSVIAAEYARDLIELQDYDFLDAIAEACVLFQISIDNSHHVERRVRKDIPAARGLDL